LFAREKKKTKKKAQSLYRVKDRPKATYFAGPSHHHPMNLPYPSVASSNIPETERAYQSKSFDREMEGHWYDSESNISDFDPKYSDEDDE